jgi:hypothetical protein
MSCFSSPNGRIEYSRRNWPCPTWTLIELRSLRDQENELPGYKSSPRCQALTSILLRPSTSPFAFDLVHVPLPSSSMWFPHVSRTFKAKASPADFMTNIIDRQRCAARPQPCRKPVSPRRPPLAGAKLSVLPLARRKVASNISGPGRISRAYRASPSGRI